MNGFFIFRVQSTLISLHKFPLFSSRTKRKKNLGSSGACSILRADKLFSRNNPVLLHKPVPALNHLAWMLHRALCVSAWLSTPLPVCLSVCLSYFQHARFDLRLPSSNRFAPSASPSAERKRNHRGRLLKVDISIWETKPRSERSR